MGADPRDPLVFLEVRESITDTDGRYEIRHLVARTGYDVRAAKEGFIDGVGEVRFEGRESVSAPDILLGKALTFSLEVVDRGGRPIDGAAVLLDFRLAWPGRHGLLRTSAWGTLELKNLQELPASMEVSAPGYVTRAVASPGPAVKIVLEKEP